MVQLKRDAIVFHSGIAKEFHASYNTDVRRRERIEVWRRYLDKYANRPALAYDIGCGSGALTFELASRVGKVVAIDGSGEMLAIADETARSLGVNNVFFRKERLPIENTAGLQTAPLVISSSVIEYLDSVDAALEFIRKLLSPDGILIFSIGNKDFISRKIVRVVYRLCGYPKYVGFVRHVLDEAGIHAVLKRANMEYLEHIYFGNRDRLNRVLAFFSRNRRVFSMILIIARRPADN